MTHKHPDDDDLTGCAFATFVILVELACVAYATMSVLLHVRLVWVP